jgi:hypothetical protein
MLANRRALYGNEFALCGSMGQRSWYIVRVACLIKANVPHGVTRVPEIDEHEPAFCHAQALATGSTLRMV